MNKKTIVLLTLLTASLNLGMARSGDQYDEEARQQEKFRKQMAKETETAEAREPMKNFATGVKQASVDNVKDTLDETAESTMREKPVIGTMDGAQKASEKVVDNTIKGVKKVVSLGYAKDDSYEIEPPKERSGDAAKVKLFQF